MNHNVFPEPVGFEYDFDTFGIIRIQDEKVREVVPIAWQALMGFLQDHGLQMWHLAEIIEYGETLFDMGFTTPQHPTNLDNELKQLYEILVEDFKDSTNLPLEIYKESYSAYMFGFSIFKVYEPTQDLKNFSKHFSFTPKLFVPNPLEHDDYGNLPF